ncbi:hypothetical protein PAMC26577_07090 [Caballeronia sordidicola]|uniref:Uncharacterized protein n=1 Tax=Caballeronia sordidicola TaxID=196367 RepID=A0A242N2H8_CABSO|nr:hypothetical protein PAMC26577_07090 [Caballeronia sordidicola]
MQGRRLSKSLVIHCSWIMLTGVRQPTSINGEKRISLINKNNQNGS